MKPKQTLILKRNIVANFTGDGWAALMLLDFILIYIHFMGIEAFGLVGFFVAMYAVMSLLDMGFTVTVNRELARLSAQRDKAQEMRDLVPTLIL